MDPQSASLRSAVGNQPPQYIATPQTSFPLAPLSFAGTLDGRASVGASGSVAQKQPWPPLAHSGFAPAPSLTPGNHDYLDAAQAQDFNGTTVSADHCLDPNLHVHDGPARKQGAAAQSHAQLSAQGANQESCQCPFCRRLHPRRSLARIARAHYAFWICHECNITYNREDLLARHHRICHQCTDPDCHQILDAKVIDNEWKTMAAQQHKSGHLPDMDDKHAQGDVGLDAAQMNQQHPLFRQFVSQCKSNGTAVAVLKRTLNESRYKHDWHGVLISWGQTLHGASPLATLSNEQAQDCLGKLQNASSTKEVLDQLFRTARFDGQAEHQGAERKQRKRRSSQSQARSPATTRVTFSLDASPFGLPVPIPEMAPVPWSLPSTAHDTRGPIGFGGPSSEGRNTVSNSMQRQGATVPSVNEAFPVLDPTDDLAFSGTSPNQNPEPLEAPMRERHRFNQDPYFAINPDYRIGPDERSEQ